MTPVDLFVSLPVTALLCLVAALVGMFFGIPSLRIKGFYLAVATLAARVDQLA